MSQTTGAKIWSGRAYFVCTGPGKQGLCEALGVLARGQASYMRALCVTISYALLV